MTLAALILLAGVVAFFLAQQQEARHDALQSIADSASAYVDGVSAMAGEVATSMSLGPGGSQELPGTVAGEAYALTVYPSYVVAGLDGGRACPILRPPLPPWQPPPGHFPA